MEPAPSDDLADGSRPQRCELATEVLGNPQEEARHLVRGPGELRPEVVALCPDPGRARVEVALSRHVAADRDQRGRPEGELLRPEERRDQQVPPRLETAVRAERD